MIRIREIALAPEHNPNQLIVEAARALKLSPARIRRLIISRRSIDARKKPDVKIVYTVDVEIDGSESKVLRACGCKRAAMVMEKRYRVPRCESNCRPVVVGFGPAGMFAALVLAMAGLKPLVLERGADAKTRKEQVERYFENGILDCRSNVQFGEGGAGTFSDRRE